MGIQFIFSLFIQSLKAIIFVYDMKLILYIIGVQVRSLYSSWRDWWSLQMANCKFGTWGVKVELEK